MLKLHILSICFLMLSTAHRGHPLKMTVCDVKYHKEKSQLVFKFKFFHDDLEAYLEKKWSKSLDLTQSSPENDQLIATFIAQHFDLNINGSAVKPRLYRTSIDDVILLAECQGSGFNTATTYEVDLKNIFLMDVFPDQYNLVRFDFWGNGNYETLRFEQKETHLTKRFTEQ